MHVGHDLMRHPTVVLKHVQPLAARGLPHRRSQGGKVLQHGTILLKVDPKLTYLIFIDHVRTKPDAVLADGADIDIFPPIAGG